MEDSKRDLEIKYKRKLREMGVVKEESNENGMIYEEMSQ